MKKVVKFGGSSLASAEFMVTINYYNPAYINSLFALKPTYLFR